MTTLSLEEAQSRLPDLVHKLEPGNDIVITENDRPIARLTVELQPAKRPRQAGSAKGILTIVRDDDEYLKDFAEYMP